MRCYGPRNFGTGKRPRHGWPQVRRHSPVSPSRRSAAIFCVTADPRRSDAGPHDLAATHLSPTLLLPLPYAPNKGSMRTVLWCISLGSGASQVDGGHAASHRWKASLGPGRTCQPAFFSGLFSNSARTRALLLQERNCRLTDDDGTDQGTVYLYSVWNRYQGGSQDHLDRRPSPRPGARAGLVMFRGCVTCQIRLFAAAAVSLL